MAALTEEEQMTFLTEVRVGVIAIEWPGHAPLSVPIWYHYEYGGEVVIWTFAESLKDKLIRSSGRFSLTVQEEQLPYRFVTVQGPVTATEPGERDFVQRLATRYLGEKRGQIYAETDYEPASVIVRMRPQRWFSGRYLYRDRYK